MSDKPTNDLVEVEQVKPVEPIEEIVEEPVDTLEPVESVESKATETATTSNKTNSTTTTTTTTTKQQETPPPTNKVETTPSTEPTNSNSITFRVTAYCACSKCCGSYANNRPIDENGNTIVIGAGGTQLISGVSCASPLPFGTKIALEGYGTVVVQDRTASWVVNKHGKYIADIYFSDHNTALQFGVKNLKGVIL